MLFFAILNQLQEMHQKSLGLGKMFKAVEFTINAHDKLIQRIQADIAVKFLKKFIPNIFKLLSEFHVHIQILFMAQPLTQTKNEIVKHSRIDGGGFGEKLA